MSNLVDYCDLVVIKSWDKYWVEVHKGGMVYCFRAKFVIRLNIMVSYIKTFGSYTTTKKMLFLNMFLSPDFQELILFS